MWLKHDWMIDWVVDHGPLNTSALLNNFQLEKREKAHIESF